MPVASPPAAAIAARVCWSSAERVLLALAAQRLDVDVVHRERRGGHQVAGAEGAEGGLDAGRGVLERQQHVVDDPVLDLGVQGPHLLGVDGGQGLLDEQHHVVGALPVVDRVVVVGRRGWSRS